MPPVPPPPPVPTHMQVASAVLLCMSGAGQLKSNDLNDVLPTHGGPLKQASS